MGVNPMRHNQVISLISNTISQDDIGNQIETPTERGED
jgi:hypothetical protein